MIYAHLLRYDDINHEVPIHPQQEPKGSYYAVGGIEVIDYIKAKLTDEQYKGYLLGNIIKYSGRLNWKGYDKEDTHKLAEYSQWLKEHGNDTN
jgi:hypothetical protein